MRYVLKNNKKSNGLTSTRTASEGKSYIPRHPYTKYDIHEDRKKTGIEIFKLVL